MATQPTSECLVGEALLQGPSECVLHVACLEFVVRDLPDFLHAEAVRLWVGVFAEIELLHDFFAAGAAGSFGEQCDAPVELIATLEAVLGDAVLVDTAVASGDTAHGALALRVL